YTFSSFATPPSIYRYDMLTGQSTLFRRAQVKFTPEDYEVKQVFYKSKDGTRVPMFLAYKKGIQFDGSNPTLSYGYGGFSIAMTQRPELFGACLPAVGVMDMLRFQKFTAGRFWVDDYGSSDNPEEFKALLAYSPYQNIHEGKHYPATLVTTADTDDRVVPGHSFKFI